MKASIPIIILALLTPHLIFSLEVMGSNKLEGRLVKFGKEYLENRLELRINFLPIYLGLRYDVAHPSDLNPITNLDSTAQGITKKYISYLSDNLTLELGDFNTSFGNGLILDAYERKELKIDKSLEGVHLDWRTKYLTINLLSGRNHWDREALLKGCEIKVGPSVLMATGEYLKYTLELGTCEVNGFNAELNFRNVNLFGEYAEKHPHQGIPGFARYAGATITIWNQSLFFEWKKYTRFLFRTARAQYNNPPWGLREPEWFLLARELYVIDYDDEQGYRTLVTLSFPGDIQAELDFARSSNTPRTKKIDEFYFKVLTEKGPGKIQLAGDYQKREFTAFTGILEGTISLSTSFSLNFDLEAQRIKENPGINHYAQIETGYKSFAYVGVSFGKAGSENGLLGEVTLNPSPNHCLRISFGKSLGGTICSGGICRYISPYKGIEASLTTMF